MEYFFGKDEVEIIFIISFETVKCSLVIVPRSWLFIKGYKVFL